MSLPEMATVPVPAVDLLVRSEMFDAANGLATNVAAPSSIFDPMVRR